MEGDRGNNVSKEDDATEAIALHTAVAKNDHQSIEELLAKDQSLAIIPLENIETIVAIYSHSDNWSFEPGMQPLHGAAWDGDGATVRMILNSDVVNVNAQDAIQEVPLHYAAWKNNCEAIAELLKQKGIAVNHKNSVSSATPLHEAANNNSSEAIAALCLQPGIDVNCKDNENCTPLHRAGWFNSKQAVAELCKHKDIQVNARGGDNQTALHLSALKNSLGAAEELVKHKKIDINAKDVFGKTVFHYAALYCDHEFIKLIIRFGVNMAIKCNNGEIGNIPTDLVEELMNDKIKMEDSEFIKADMKTVEFDFSMFLPFTAVPSSESTTVDIGTDNEGETIPLQAMGPRGKDPKKESDPIHTETQLLVEIVGLKEENIQLLNHPLIKSFLSLKWQKITHIHTCWILFKLFFNLILVTLALVEYWPNPQDFELNSTLALNTVNTVNATLDSKQCYPNTGSVVLRTMLGVFVFFLLIVEIVQVLAYSLDYFKSFTNYVQLLIFGGSLFLVSSVDPDLCTYRRHVAGIVLPFAYLETLRELGTHPRRSHIFQMFLKVTGTFFTYLFWYVFLIISCGISFFIIFGTSIEAEARPYSNFQEVILKTFVMFIGEIEFTDIPITIENTGEGIFNYILEFILLIFFLTVAVLILMNLLNGLAVYDTEKIQADATVIGLNSTLHILAFFESVLLGNPDYFLKYSLLSSLFKKYFQKIGIVIWKRYFELISNKKKFRFSIQPKKRSSNLIFKLIDDDDNVDEHNHVKNQYKGLYLTKPIMYSAIGIINDKKAENKVNAIEEDTNKKTDEQFNKIDSLSSQVIDQYKTIESLNKQVKTQNTKIDEVQNKLNEMTEILLHLKLKLGEDSSC